jgi:hypothetical protein
VALDPRHKTHNIPGKFLSYMLSGLPVIASINPGNDLVSIITKERLGRVCTNHSSDNLANLIIDLIDDLQKDPGFNQRCYLHGQLNFSPVQAVQKIVRQLST